MKNVDFKILAESNELCIRGRNVSMGYIKQSNKAMDEEGYFHTGDAVDINNCQVRIIGRVKETIINVAGENIDPSFIERIFKEEC